MLVLHGSWVPAHGSLGSRFALWGEVPTVDAATARQPRARHSAPQTGRRLAGTGGGGVRRGPSPRAEKRAALSRGGPPPHPFAASDRALQASLEAAGAWSAAGPIHGQALVARLPSAGRWPVPSPDLPWDRGEPAEPMELATWLVPALVVDAAAAPALLLSLPEGEPPTDLAFGPDLRFWQIASRFTVELLCRERLRPALEHRDGAYLAHWKAVLDEAADADRFAALARAMPPAGRALAWDPEAPEPGPRDLLRSSVDAVVDAVARQAPAPSAGASARRRASPRQGRPPAERWLAALFDDPVVPGEPDELARFERQLGAWFEAAEAGAGPGDAFRVCFRLDPPAAEPGGGVAAPRRETRDWALQYLLQAADDPSLLVPAAAVWRQRGATARFLDRWLEEPHERLLAGLGRAARLFPPIEGSLRTARPEACALTTAEAHAFVRDRALLLKESGFGVLVPGLETKLSLRLKLKGGRSAPGATPGQAAFGWDTLVEYDWQLALGDQTLTREEFEALAQLKEPLVQVRGQWVELRPERVERALVFFERQGPGQMQLQEALKLALAPDGEVGFPVAEVSAEGWVEDLLARLRGGEQREEVAEPAGFVGQLRPYQKAGVAWLAALRRYGLGGILADDMGLGKTIQLIALLLHQRRDGAGDTPRPTLLICPTSVVENWRHELARFAPSLRVLVHHGISRQKETFAEEAARHDVVISTYALLHRDEQELAAVEWGDVVLDEAQNVKNASTRSAQVARALRARWRAALTGTPVENRLADLWSLFQFLNAGYLGSAEAFRKRFALPIERAHDAAATARLKALVAPFVLRRVKSDRAIIQDLPEKNEMKVYCTLTREQATLYEAVVRESMRQIEAAEGVQRRGQILATLTKLKQVCNHPSLFLHDGSRLEGRSGKLARLREMLEEALAVGDRALLFTQYAEMGSLLNVYLAEACRREVLFLHGGTPAKERDRMVARFQAESHGPPLFILSLKAGGTGLNLTRANHVFHFDRWWNPAVENQATDRAFRIGQTRSVQVHKFVTAGTFEEKLDELIARKTELAEAIVGAGEAWITELSAAELRDLFALRADAVGEE